MMQAYLIKLGLQCGKPFSELSGESAAIPHKHRVWDRQDRRLATSTSMAENCNTQTWHSNKSIENNNNTETK